MSATEKQTKHRSQSATERQLCNPTVKSKVEVVTTASALISNFGEDSSSLDIGKGPILHGGEKIKKKA